MINEKRNVQEKPYKIMIVDDDQMVVKTLERLLFKKNYLFFSVESGERAIEMVSKIEPDIILLDIMLEQLDGYDVCEILKGQPGTASIPIIFLTSTTDSESVLKGFRAGAVDYIVKPFNAEELLARLETHLELKRSREDIKMMEVIKARFFSIVTNEIHDTFTGIKGVAEFLHHEIRNEQDPNEESLKLSSLLLEDSRQLYYFLENLLEWNNIETDSREFTPENFSVADVVEELKGEFSEDINRKKLSLKVSEMSDEKIFTSRSAFLSIFRRLLSNAIKYSRQGQNIWIGFQKQQNNNLFTIRDEGVGMDKDVLENIFRLDTPHPKTIGTAQEKGVGISLVICHALVEKLRGTIEISSEKHKGVKIDVSIPDMHT